MAISPCQTQIFDPNQNLAQPTEHVDDRATGSSNSPPSRLLRPKGHASDLRGPRPSYGERARLRQAHAQDSLAEWSKALAPGASPQGRGFEPHSCHFARLACVRARPRSVNETLRAQLVLRHPASACLCALAEQALHAAPQDSLAEWSGAGSRRKSARAWVRTPQLTPYVAASSRIVGEEHVATARPCAPKEWRGVAKRVKTTDVAWRT